MTSHKGKFLLFLGLLLTCGAAGGARTAEGQDAPAPIQVQIAQGDATELYACYPTDEVLGMMVFLNTPTGTAAYACYLSGVDRGSPAITPHSHSVPINWEF
jgi:hypothetical protein